MLYETLVRNSHELFLSNLLQADRYRLLLCAFDATKESVIYKDLNIWEELKAYGIPDWPKYMEVIAS